MGARDLYAASQQGPSATALYGGAGAAGQTFDVGNTPYQVAGPFGIPITLTPNALPTVAGAIGQGVGSVGGFGGSLLGGTLGQEGGEGLRQMQMSAMGAGPTSAGESVRALGTQGAIGAASTLGGEALSAAMSPLARGLMRAALLPAKAIRQGFRGAAAPEVTALEGKILPGVGKAAGDKAVALRNASTAAAENLLEQGSQAGNRWTPELLAEPEVQRQNLVMLKRTGRGLSQAQRDQVVSNVTDMVNEALKNEASSSSTVVKDSALNPHELNTVKQYLSNAAKKDWIASNASTLAAAQPKTAMILSGHAKNLLESMPGVGQQLAKTNALTQKYIGLARTLRNRELGDATPLAVKMGVRGGPAAVGAGIGAYSGHTPEDRLARSAEGAALGAALSNPAFLGLLAHSLNNPGAQTIASLLPRLLAGMAQPNYQQAGNP